MKRTIKWTTFFKVAKVQRVVLSLSYGIFLILVIPFLHNGIPSGHDIVFHTIYLRLFTDALWQGQFPVRWIEWFRPGLSQPLFLFYQPLYYYLAQIPHILSFSLADSAKATILFLWLLSGFYSYLFVKNITRDAMAGMVAAVVFVFSPYHIVDVFVRAAYPEITALGFIPALFWTTERLFATNKKIYAILLSVFFAAVLVAHLPTLLIFAFPYICYLGYLFLSSFKKKKLTFRILLFVLVGLLGGLGLSSFFWLPAFLEQSAIQTVSLRSGYYDFHQHFVCFSQLFSSSWGYGFSNLGCVDGMSFQIGLVNVIVLLLGIFVCLYMGIKKNFSMVFINLSVWVVLALWGMYMTTYLSLPIWSHIPYLSFIQYPWRFLSVIMFSIAFITGILFSLMEKNYSRIFLYVVFIAIFVGSVFPYLHPKEFFSLTYFGQDADSFYKTISPGQKHARQEFGYFPQGAKILLPSRQVPASEIGSTKGPITVWALTKKFTYISYGISAKADTTLTIFIHHFPGWRYFIDTKETMPVIVNIYGYPQFHLSKGRHVVYAFFDNTFTAWIGNLSSSIVFLLLCVFFWLTNNHETEE